jgi:hypothetical protein
MKVSCSRCNKEFTLSNGKREVYNLDGLCGKCRSRREYLLSIKKGARKTKQCSCCGSPILKTSTYCYKCANTGDKNPGYTDGHSSKTRACLVCGESISSGSLEGKCFSCYSKTLSGVGNPNYKHGIYSNNLLNTKEYTHWKLYVFERGCRICAMCGKEVKHTGHAHHILPKRDHPELIFDKDNGITLCKECHASINYDEYTHIDFFNKIIAELKIRELGEPCNGNT